MHMTEVSSRSPVDLTVSRTIRDASLSRGFLQRWRQRKRHISRGSEDRITIAGASGRQHVGVVSRRPQGGSARHQTYLRARPMMERRLRLESQRPSLAAMKRAPDLGTLIWAMWGYGITAMPASESPMARAIMRDPGQARRGPKPSSRLPLLTGPWRSSRSRAMRYPSDGDRVADMNENQSARSTGNDVRKDPTLSESVMLMAGCAWRGEQGGNKEGGRGGGRYRTFLEAAAFVGVCVEAVVGSELLSAARAVHYQSRVPDIRDGCKPSGLMDAWQSRDRRRGCE